MPDTDTGLPAAQAALPNGDARMAVALDVSGAPPGDDESSAGVNAEPEEEQKPAVLALTDGPAVKVLLQNLLPSNTLTSHMKTVRDGGGKGS